MSSSRLFTRPIWYRILREATYHPALDDTEWTYPPSELLWDSRRSTEINSTPAQVMPHVNLTAKRTLVLTCRNFHSIAIEFLWEWIIIPPHRGLVQKTLVALRQIFDASRQRTGNVDYGYGKFVRRFEFPARALVESIFGDLNALLLRLGGVHTLIMHPMERPIKVNVVLKTLVNTINKQFRRSLQRLDIKRDTHLQTLHLFHPLDLPNLRSLEVHLSTGAVGNVPDFPSPSYTSITSLVISVTTFMSKFPDEAFIFPNLRHLSILNTQKADLTAVKRLVGAHGEQLTSLHLSSRLDEQNQLPLPLDAFEELISLMPNLNSLVFHAWFWSAEGGMFPLSTMPFDSAFFSEDPEVGGIEYVGIINLSKWSAGELVKLVESDFGPRVDDMELDEEPERMTSVKAVRLLGDFIWDPDWEELPLILRKYGMRLEDEKGRLLGACWAEEMTMET